MNAFVLHGNLMRRWILVICVFLSSGWLFAANENGTPSAKAPTQQEKLEALQTIAVPLSTAIAEAAQLQAELNQASSADEKSQIQSRIDAERKRIEQLRENFRTILGGSEAAEYEDVSEGGKGMQEQISELLQPVLSEMREATSGPRELDALRNAHEAANERMRKADIVLNRIAELVKATEDQVVVAELKYAERIWASRQAEANSQIAVTKVQIDERTRSQRSLWERLSTGFSKFFRSRGMNLLLAALAGAFGYIATRKIYSWLRMISPAHKGGHNTFTSRISDILAMGLAVVVSLSAVILVFYARSDWLLLTLVVIFLIGVAWAGKTAIPPYLEQIRMILNLGSVREGERVIYRGLPWKVSKLGFFTIFTNPRLQGGHIRVPIQDVMGMISRPIAKKEVWFPCEEDDWVVLSDETYGKAIIQTPDQVVVLRLGGSMKTYPTSDFLELAPENLSHGFRISLMFGIDYKHQADCTTTILRIFNESLTSKLLEECAAEAVRSLKVEFASASSSSLNYEILADFDGSVASKMNALSRKIQAFCVDICNENGWVIPFTQITVHQSEEGAGLRAMT